MRLAPACPNPPLNPVAGSSTLDEVLAHNAARDPNGTALVGPGLTFDGTWRETDRVVSALAQTFGAWRLERDAVVGVQLGSSAEAALVCLGLWRAGLIAALLPLPWRRREVAAALEAVGAQAVVAPTAAAGGRPGEAACEAAFSLDRLRFIATFGDDAPDGATPLDDALDEPAAAGFAASDRPHDAADHVAVITFDAGATPVARTHNELVALGLMPLLASRLGDGDRLLSTLDLAGLPGLATGLVPWLVTRATASFHQASTTAAFADAARDASHIALPGRALERLIADGAFEHASPVAVIAAWRAPDPRTATAAAAVLGATMVDVIALGEAGLVAGARPAPSRALALPLGVHAPEGLATLIETRVARDGRLLVRGPVCPGGVFAPSGGSGLAIDADGFAATGFIGFVDRAANHVTLGGRQTDAIQIGGVAVARADAEAAFEAVGLAGAVDVQDDAILGGRVRLTLEPGADAVGAGDAAEMLEAAGYGPALAPRTVVAESARRSA